MWAEGRVGRQILDRAQSSFFFFFFKTSSCVQLQFPFSTAPTWAWSLTPDPHEWGAQFSPLHSTHVLSPVHRHIHCCSLTFNYHDEAGGVQWKFGTIRSRWNTEENICFPLAFEGKLWLLMAITGEAKSPVFKDASTKNKVVTQYLFSCQWLPIPMFNLFF